MLSGLLLEDPAQIAGVEIELLCDACQRQLWVSIVFPDILLNFRKTLLRLLRSLESDLIRDLLDRMEDPLVDLILRGQTGQSNIWLRIRVKALVVQTDICCSVKCGRYHIDCEHPVPLQRDLCVPGAVKKLLRGMDCLLVQTCFDTKAKLGEQRLIDLPCSFLNDHFVTVRNDLIWRKDLPVF